jgi:drug/metabolite transporter (DMT)-like permease
VPDGSAVRRALRSVLMLRATHRTAWVGLACAATAAICFASKSIFAKLLYADGWDFESVISVRALLALPLIWATAWWRSGQFGFGAAPRSALIGSALAGVLCYYVGVVADFGALTLIDASVERALLFSYPSMVVVLRALIDRQAPMPATFLALALTYGGILLVVTGSGHGAPAVNSVGVWLVLGCAFTYALFYLASERWTPVLGSVNFTVAAMSAATFALTAHVLVRRGLPYFRATPRDLGLLAGLVLLATVLPMFLTAEGVRRLGAQRAAIVSSVGPPTTIALGALALGEQFALPQWLGVALIIAGILVLELRWRRRSRAR